MKPLFKILRHRVRVPNLMALATAALLVGTSVFTPTDRDAAQQDMSKAAQSSERPALIADASPDAARDRQRSLRTSLLLLLPRG